MIPLEPTGEQLLCLLIAGTVIALIWFLFRPSAYSAAAFSTCLVAAALMFVAHARPQIARPPMSEEAAIYRKQLDASNIEKDRLESRLADAERELSKAKFDQIRLAEALVAFEKNFPRSLLDAAPLHIRVNRAAEDGRALKAKIEVAEQRLLATQSLLLEMTNKTKILQSKADHLDELNIATQAALSDLRRQNRMLVARRQLVSSRLAARIVKQRKLQADLQTARLTASPHLTSNDTLCDPLTDIELAEVATDHRRLPERFGNLKGFKITLRKRDGTPISLRGIPPGLQQPDEHLDLALEALTNKLDAVGRGCSPQAVLIKTSANLQPIISKRPSSEYHYAQTIRRYTEDASTGALDETTALTLTEGDLTNSDLPDVRSAYVAEKLRRFPGLRDVHLGIISGEIAADSTRQPELLIFIPRQPLF